MFAPLVFADFPAFTLVFVRVAAVIGTMPLFGEQSVPRPVKASLALVLAMILFPSVSGAFAGNMPANILGWIPALVMEVMFGAVMGYAIRLITTAVEFAGEIVGYMLGLTMAQAVDPQTNLSVPIIGQFLSVLAFLIFLAINAHHTLISALVTSFEWLPPMGLSVGKDFATLLIDLVFELFRMGLQIATPIVAAILLANVGMGVISRAVPQMHVMMVAMPATIAIGFLLIGLSLPFIINLTMLAFAGLDETLYALMATLR
jgi:flagellar biosynthetic protein FliR